MKFKNTGLLKRSIVYVGIGIMLFLSLKSAKTFLEKPQDGVLPPVNIDKVTVDYMKAERWDLALDDLIPLIETTYDPHLKLYIAWCFKELGTEAFLDHRYADSVAFSESGLEYAPDDADLHLIHGAARLAQSEYKEAEAAFIKAIEVDPDNAEAHKQLGQIYYLRNELEKAEESWSTALSFDPGDTVLENRLVALRKQLHLNETLDTDDNLHFSVTYDGDAMPGLEHTVLETLENAYYEIGGKLQIYPKRLISVTLLTREAFFDVTGSPDWTAGLYEGQIKIPVAGASPDRLKKTLYHEYTHAVLFDQLGSKCPWWLNEGLAQYLSENGNGNMDTDFSTHEKASKPDGITLSGLGNVFGLDEKTVTRSYSTALSGVRYLVASFGEATIQKLIMLMSEEDSFETAFYTVTGYSFDQFEDAWRKNG